MSEEFPTPQLLDELEDSQKVTNVNGKKELSPNRVLKDIFAGTVGGIAQVLVGQPFDTTKVRLQTATTRTTTLDVLRNLVKNEGVFAFYKGALTPVSYTHLDVYKRQVLGSAKDIDPSRLLYSGQG